MKVKVNVQAFGPLTDILEKEFSIEAADTHELMATLAKRHASLSGRKILIAVNNVIEHKNTALQKHDLVALMPPYSGG